MEKQDDVQQEGTGSTQKSNKPIIIIFIIVIVALLGVIAWLLFFRGSGDEDTNDRVVLVDENNKDTVMDELDDKVAKGMFECKMTMTWNFTGGGMASSDAYVANSEHNTYAIFFDVIDNDTQETLYSSPYIVVGSEISGFVLDKKLTAGSHEATVMYTLVDQDNDYEEISSAGFIVTLNVTD